MKCEQCLKNFKWEEDGSYTPICSNCKGIDTSAPNRIDIITFLSDNIITQEEYNKLNEEDKRKFDGDE